MLFKDALTGARLNATHLFSLGQAGFIIKNQKGETLGIDLYLSDCVEYVEGHDGYHRMLPRIVQTKDIILDAVIATHSHRDHFDKDSMYDLMDNGKTRLFCAKDCAKDVKELGIDVNRVTYVSPGDNHKIGNFDVLFLRCDHGSGAPHAVGVLVSVDNINILEVGDTCLHLEWKNEYLSSGPINVLIAPINGAFGNLNEEEHVMLTKELRPKLTVPCHFGMFASHGGNPGLWLDMIHSMLPNQKYKIFTMGEGIEII